MRVAIYGLLYGDYFKLHERLVNSLMAALPLDSIGIDIDVYFWGNQIPQRTLDLVEGTPFSIGWSDANVPKYKLMREKMFKDVPPDDYDWMVWFDDDSWITQPNLWLNSMLKLIEAKKAENICYIGEAWYWDWRAGQWDFVTQSPWFKNKPPEAGRKPRITFAQGGLWWLRTDIRKMLDWPDKRLSHNGGDTLLGEAIRQQGLPFHKVHKGMYGFRTNDAKRRGMSQFPAGQV